MDNNRICPDRADPVLHDRYRYLCGLILHAQLIACDVELDLTGGMFRKDKVNRFFIEFIPGRWRQFNQAICSARPKSPTEVLQITNNQNSAVCSCCKGDVLTITVLDRNPISIFHIKQLERRTRQCVRKRFGIPFYNRDAGIASRSSAGGIYNRNFLHRHFKASKLNGIRISDIPATKHSRLISNHKGCFIWNLCKR